MLPGVIIFACATGIEPKERIEPSTANISNVTPRHDSLSRLMDVHDGNILQDAGMNKWYWYGMGYGNCSEQRGWIPPRDCPGIYKPFGECGFRTDHAVNVYSSTDLASWTFEGDALPLRARPLGIYFRPKVVFNSRTRE